MHNNNTFINSHEYDRISYFAAHFNALRAIYNDTAKWLKELMQCKGFPILPPPPPPPPKKKKKKKRTLSFPPFSGPVLNTSTFFRRYRRNKTTPQAKAHTQIRWSFRPRWQKCGVFYSKLFPNSRTSSALFVFSQWGVGIYFSSLPTIDSVYTIIKSITMFTLLKP